MRKVGGQKKYKEEEVKVTGDVRNFWLDKATRPGRRTIEGPPEGKDNTPLMRGRGGAKQ